MRIYFSVLFAFLWMLGSCTLLALILIFSLSSEERIPTYTQSERYLIGLLWTIVSLGIYMLVHTIILSNIFIRYKSIIFTVFVVFHSIVLGVVILFDVLNL